MKHPFYSPHYQVSWALIIGIDEYEFVSPLGYAVSDATAVAEILKEKFDFPEENIKVLTNESATRENIMSSFMSFRSEDIHVDDRIIVFYAGHGDTQTGRRGEVGYLIPHNGNPEDLSTLIRWDELTRNSDLIVAKHVLFVMDACYGGLAITRRMPSGSMRFLKDMLQRYSRQVITAGKANEEVADSGGPLPNHSIFTGHFLEGLNGKAVSSDGVISANSIMAYVYENVGKDRYSQQTPHYGYIDGDGDFFFQYPDLSESVDEDNIDKDILITSPVLTTKQADSVKTDLDLVKEYLSDIRYKIKLDDLINQKIRDIKVLLSDKQFEVQNIRFSLEEFNRRLELYEEITKEMRQMISSIAYWGNSKHFNLLSKILARLSDDNEPKSGYQHWIALKWYPIFLLLYSAGISALASENYNALTRILMTQVQSNRNIYDNIEIASLLGDTTADLHDSFKNIPGHEKFYVPRSEYLFKHLQPEFEDLLFLGRDYERFFDRFEVFFALVFIDLKYNPEAYLWGPLGRFAYKYRGLSGRTNPFSEVVNEAKRSHSEWLPLKAGLFSGSIERFTEISSKFGEFMQGLNWR